MGILTPGGSLENQYKYLAVDVEFNNRVQMGYIHCAREVLTEESTVTGHELRIAMARAIILESGPATPTYVSLIASDPTVIQEAVLGAGQKAVPDDSILNAIRSTWNFISGV